MFGRLTAAISRRVATALLPATLPRPPRRERLARWAYEHASEAGQRAAENRQLDYEQWRARSVMLAKRANPARESIPYPAFNTLGYARQKGLRALPKPIPINMRYFSQTAVAQRAIGKVKSMVTTLPWRCDVRGLKQGKNPSAEQQKRIDVVEACMRHPNNDGDSWTSFLEQIVEEVLVAGAGAVEVKPWKGNKQRPFLMWPVDALSIQINWNWVSDDDADEGRAVRYVQSFPYGGVGLWTSAAPIGKHFQDWQLMYARFRPRANTPFGYGPLEAAFNAINAWLGAMDAREREESNEVPPFGLHLGEGASDADAAIWREDWIDAIEGQGQIPIWAGGKQPQVLDFRQQRGAANENQWNDLLMRVIAISFGLPPQAMGIEKDANRCVDSLTETLTYDGWRTLDSLLADSELINRESGGAENRRVRCRVAGFNPVADRIEWVEPTLLHVSQYTGDMIHFRSTKADVLVTPKHNMWRRSARGEYGKQWAEDIETETVSYFRVAPKNEEPDLPTPAESFVIPGCETGRQYGPDYPAVTVPMRLWLEFLGWFISEGYVSPAAPRHYVTLSQSADSPHAERLRLALAAMPFTFAHYVRNHKESTDEWYWQVGAKQLANWIRTHVGGDQSRRRIPEFVWDLPRKLQAVLFDALMAGDGCWYASDSRCVPHQAEATHGYYATICEELADDVQRLAFSLGHRSQVAHTKRGFFHVNIALGKTEVCIQRSGVTREPYTGLVYCFEVPPHHLFVTRRNGKITIQGNTNADVQQSDEFTSGAVPVIKVIEDAFTSHIIEKLLGWDDLEIKAAMSQGDPLKQAQRLEILTGANIILIDEAREELAKEPMADGKGALTNAEHVQAVAPPPPEPGQHPADRLAQELGKPPTGGKTPLPGQPPGGGKKGGNGKDKALAAAREEVIRAMAAGKSDDDLISIEIPDAATADALRRVMDRESAVP